MPSIEEIGSTWLPSPDTRQEHISYPPQAPRTPSPRAHHLIFKYQGSELVTLIIGIVFTLIGSLVSAVFGYELFANGLIASSPMTTRATPKDTYIQNNVKINGVRPTCLQYVYVVDETEYENSFCSVDISAHRIQKEAVFDGFVEVEYASFAPSISTVKGFSSGPFGWIGVFPLLFPIIGLTLVVVSIRHNRSEIYAFRYGVITKGSITYRGHDRSTKMNGRHPYLLQWEFVVGDQTYTGKITSMTTHLFGPLWQSRDVYVLYDEKNPRRNTVYLD